MNQWSDYVKEVQAKGFGNASPVARLVWSCDVGQIDQHASPDLDEVSRELALFEIVKKSIRCGCNEQILGEADGVLVCWNCGKNVVIGA
jgi:hypothetical protein